MGIYFRVGEFKTEFIRSATRASLLLDAVGKNGDGSDVISFSYGGAEEFQKAVGLYSLFTGEEPGQEGFIREDYLIQEDPSCVPLTDTHKREIDAAMVRFKTGPHKEDGFYRQQLCWLQERVDWALKNCKEPVFVNS